MNCRVSLQVKDVTVRYPVYNDRISSLKEYLIKSVKGELKKEYFCALKNINCDVKIGDILGIVGRNGAGKSTFLKVASGIFQPHFGQVIRNGNIVPMLELGAGFDMDMTGKENIYLNGAVLGYSKAFLDEKYEEITAFADIGNFIYSPLRNYSSGMLARLAFSIATVVKPEILIVDEVLSVGDATFVQKSYDRMVSLMKNGTTVLFVSHSVDAIKSICNRAIWLEKGEMKADGDVYAVCREYESFIQTLL